MPSFFKYYLNLLLLQARDDEIEFQRRHIPADIDPLHGVARLAL
jgi:hypothetical protein